MPRRVTKHDVTNVILAWLDALSAAASCRSVSAQLARAAQLGCRVSGGQPPAPRLVRLVEAERPLSCLTAREKQLLVAKYSRVRVEVIERMCDGRRTDYQVRRWASDADVARSLGAPSAAAVTKRLTRARAKIGMMLEGGEM